MSIIQQHIFTTFLCENNMFFSFTFTCIGSVKTVRLSNLNHKNKQINKSIKYKYINVKNNNILNEEN